MTRGFGDVGLPRRRRGGPKVRKSQVRGSRLTSLKVHLKGKEGKRYAMSGKKRHVLEGKLGRFVEKLNALKRLPRGGE